MVVPRNPRVVNSSSETWLVTGTSTGSRQERTRAALERGDRVATAAREADRLHPAGRAVLPCDHGHGRIIQVTGPYSTDFGGGSVRVSAEHPDHAQVRTRDRTRRVLSPVGRLDVGVGLQ